MDEVVVPGTREPPPFSVPIPGRGADDVYGFGWGGGSDSAPPPEPEPAPPPEELPEVTVTARRPPPALTPAFVAPWGFAPPTSTPRTLPRSRRRTRTRPRPARAVTPLGVLALLFGKAISFFAGVSDRKVRQNIERFSEPELEREVEELPEIRIIGTRPRPELAPFPSPPRPPGLRWPRVLPADIFQDLFGDRPGEDPTPIGDPFPQAEPQPAPRPPAAPSPSPRTPVIQAPSPFPAPVRRPFLQPVRDPRPFPYNDPRLRPFAVPGPRAFVDPTSGLTPFREPGLGFQPRPLPQPPGVNTAGCACPEPRKRRKRKPRLVCYKGSFRERRNSLSKRRRERIPCE